MKVKDLLSILETLDSDLEVKMYLFSPVSFLADGREEVFNPLRVDCYNINDVLVSSFGNAVLLSSSLNLYHNI